MSNQDRGIEVRDLIAHLQTLDPFARMSYTTDGYTDTPVCTKDFVRQASGTVGITLPTELINELECMSDDDQQDMHDLEDENDRLEHELNAEKKKLSKLESALASIRRSVDEVVGS